MSEGTLVIATPGHIRGKNLATVLVPVRPNLTQA